MASYLRVGPVCVYVSSHATPSTHLWAPTNRPNSETRKNIQDEEEENAYSTSVLSESLSLSAPHHFAQGLWL